MPDDSLRFIQVGELVKGISEGTLPQDDGLAGRELELSSADGSVTRLTFSGAGSLAWEVTGGSHDGEQGEEACLVTRPRNEIAVVDYVASTRRATAVTIVLDLARGAATTVTGTLPTAEEAARSAFDLASERRRAHPGRRRHRSRASSTVRGPRRTPARPDRRARGQAGAVRLQPDRGLRAHLPEREPVHVAVSARQRAGTRGHRPLSLPADRRRAVPLRVAREGHPHARRRARRLGRASAPTASCSGTRAATSAPSRRPRSPRSPPCSTSPPTSESLVGRGCGERAAGS